MRTKKTITTIAQIAAAVIRSSKATIPAYLNVQLKRGKVMADVTTATISAAAIGTVVIVVPKQTRNWTRHLSCSVVSVHAWIKRKPNVARNAKCSPGIRTKNATTKTITADATGTAGIAVDLITTIATATVARAWMRIMSMKMRSAKKIVLCISGRGMDDVTMTTMFVVVTGTVETAVDTTKTAITISMDIARSVSAATRLYPKPALANARCSRGVEMATATTETTTAAAVGMAETVVEKRRRFYTVTSAVARIRITRALYAPNHVTRVLGRETKRAMMKITIVVVLGTVATAVALAKIMTTFTAASVSVWTPKNS